MEIVSHCWSRYGVHSYSDTAIYILNGIVQYSTAIVVQLSIANRHGKKENSAMARRVQINNQCLAVFLHPRKISRRQGPALSMFEQDIALFGV